MQLVLEKRAERSNTIALVSPLIAIGLTIVTMVILFAILGKNPLLALHAYFIAPLTDSYSLQEIAVKDEDAAKVRAQGFEAWQDGVLGKVLALNDDHVGGCAASCTIRHWPPSGDARA